MDSYSQREETETKELSCCSKQLPSLHISLNIVNCKSKAEFDI